ncbi:MAG: hypothetical protein QG577_22 [Thermodesulfobacteriota bacterium]|nr:hypothetical protein [Thermodesulfobacteriota bacterium]
MDRPRRNILIIANPIAGTGQTVQRVNALEAVLLSRNHHVEIYLTEKPGDARHQAEGLEDRFHCVVVAGGDGTVNEVINGLREPFTTPLIHMGTGTANQLAAHLGIPRNPKLLVSVIENGLLAKIDLGLVNNHRFILQTSAGFDASVTKIFANRPRARLGYLEYAVPIFRSLTKNSLQDMEVRIDDGPTTMVRGIMVTKVSRYGGLFVFCPTASLNSGSFEICLFKERLLSAHVCSYLAALFRISRLVPWMKVERGTRVRIQSDHPIPVQVDGTYSGTTPVDVRLIPAVIPVLVPDRVCGLQTFGTAKRE